MSAAISSSLMRFIRRLQYILLNTFGTQRPVMFSNNQITGDAVRSTVLMATPYRIETPACTDRDKTSQTRLGLTSVKRNPIPFLQGVSIALLCKPCISHRRDVCPSVCPSHAGTEWKRRKLGSPNLHQRIAPRTLVFGTKNSLGNSSEALNESGVGKIRNFQPITRRISETVQDRTKD